MKKKSLIIAATCSLALGIASSNLSTEAADKKLQKGGEIIHSEPQSIETAVEKVPFNVELPNEEDLPIKLKHKNAESSKVSEYDLFEVSYYGENNNLLTLQVLDHEVKIMQDSEFQYETVELKNNITAKYIDNGYSQILIWEKDGKSYTLNYYPSLPEEGKQLKKGLTKIEKLELKNLTKVANTTLK